MDEEGRLREDGVGMKEDESMGIEDVQEGMMGNEMRFRHYS